MKANVIECEAPKYAIISVRKNGADYCWDVEIQLSTEAPAREWGKKDDRDICRVMASKAKNGSQFNLYLVRYGRVGVNENKYHLIAARTEREAMEFVEFDRYIDDAVEVGALKCRLLMDGINKKESGYLFRWIANEDPLAR